MHHVIFPTTFRLLVACVNRGCSILCVRPQFTHLVEHPVPVAPPAEAPPPPPQPLKLTKREQKKLRTQRRVAREKERQEMVRQGLLEPPKPKVKISNLMRVLTAEATADPTAVEQEARGIPYKTSRTCPCRQRTCVRGLRRRPDAPCRPVPAAWGSATRRRRARRGRRRCGGK